MRDWKIFLGKVGKRANIAISPGSFIHSFIHSVIIEHLPCEKQFCSLETHYRTNQTLARAHDPGARGGPEDNEQSNIIRWYGSEDGKCPGKKQRDDSIGKTYGWEWELGVGLI